jgi:hypothetical protein
LGCRFTRFPSSPQQRGQTGVEFGFGKQSAANCDGELRVARAATKTESGFHGHGFR